MLLWRRWVCWKASDLSFFFPALFIYLFFTQTQKPKTAPTTSQRAPRVKMTTKLLLENKINQEVSRSSVETTTFL